MRGFTQCYGINYEETFSPIVRSASVRVIIALAANRNMKTFQLDMKTAFLYGDLKENIYMRQPIDYDDKSGKVCKLVKSLYGLKQASRCCNEKFTHFIKRSEFKVCEADPCVFVRKDGDDMTILAIHVDDGLVCGTNESKTHAVLDFLVSSSR